MTAEVIAIWAERCKPYRVRMVCGHEEQRMMREATAGVPWSPDAVIESRADCEGCRALAAVLPLPVPPPVLTPSACVPQRGQTSPREIVRGAREAEPVRSAPARPRYTSAAEDAAEIRADLKRRGWGRREVSVRSDSYSGGSSIRVEILSGAVPLSIVEPIANKAERIHRDASGEILSGANRYVDVSYSDAATAEVRGILERAAASLVPGTHTTVEVAPGATITIQCDRDKGPNQWWAVNVPALGRWSGHTTDWTAEGLIRQIEGRCTNARALARK